MGPMTLLCSIIVSALEIYFVFGKSEQGIAHVVAMITAIVVSLLLLLPFSGFNRTP